MDLRLLGFRSKERRKREGNLNGVFQFLNGSLILGSCRCFRDWIGLDSRDNGGFDFS